MKHMLRSVISWYRSSLLPQFVSLAVVTAILFVLASQIVTSNYFTTSLRHAIDTVESDTILIQAQNIERQLHTYVSSVYEIIIDRDIFFTASALWQSESSQKAALKQNLRQLISGYAKNNIVGITVVLPNKQVVFYNRLYGAWQGLPWFANTLNSIGSDDQLFTLYEQTYPGKVIVPWFQPYIHEGTDTYLLHLAYPLIDLYSQHKCGILVVSINTKTLQSMVNPVRDSAKETPLSYNILTSADGQIIAHPDRLLIGKTLCLDVTPVKEQTPDKVYFSKDFLIIQEPVNRLGLQLYSVNDKQITARQARAYTSSLVFTISMITLAQLSIFYLMMRRMMYSVRALQKGLETVHSGQLNVRVNPVGKHEVAQSIIAFNDMSVRLEHSEASSRRHAERTIAALERQRTAEIKTLENQINSHFLYNTLSSISYSAIRSGNLLVSKQIKHLSQVLRYTFEKSDGIVQAAQEARWLEEYLQLQKLRYGDAFDYVVRVDPRVSVWPMRKLIIQPFVENSVLHGFKGYTFGRFLTIEFAWYTQGRMRVTVRDNGMGISPERLSVLQASIHKGHCGEGEMGIGLENACQRISTYYKNEARVYLRSWEGVGTTVVLLLPRYRHPKDEE